MHPRDQLPRYKMQDVRWRRVSLLGAGKGAALYLAPCILHLLRFGVEICEPLGAYSAALPSWSSRAGSAVAIRGLVLSGPVRASSSFDTRGGA